MTLPFELRILYRLNKYSVFYCKILTFYSPINNSNSGISCADDQIIKDFPVLIKCPVCKEEVWRKLALHER